MSDRTYPIDLTPDLREILGRPNFWCGPIAHAFRDAGEWQVARKAEEEQAAVLHWLIGLYLEHGADWRKQANRKLDEVLGRLKSADPAASEHGG